MTVKESPPARFGEHWKTIIQQWEKKPAAAALSFYLWNGRFQDCAVFCRWIRRQINPTTSPTTAGHSQPTPNLNRGR